MSQDRDDDDDDRPIKRRPSGGGGGVDNIIPFKNGMALGAYYCGIFGLISCFIGLGIFGIVPIILGFMGLKRAGEDPEARGRVHAWVGIILGAIEVLTCVASAVVVGIIIATDKRR